MHIAIIGTRGIPNNYGGFEQFAEQFSTRLVALGHKVTVYNPHLHPYKGRQWKGVNIVHRKDPEQYLGAFGQFIYDLNCILHARRQQYDIILQLGYTSSAIWGWLMPRKRAVIITNMDGLEWQRTKYSALVKRFLLFSERLAVHYSDQLVADALGIKEYIAQKYNRHATYISYGAQPIHHPNERALKKYQLKNKQYNLLIARLEPDNNIELILEGSTLQDKPIPFLVIGNDQKKYGQQLKKKFANWPHIRFLNAVYITDDLNNLRYYSNIYFHGHSVGGTNPSLIEAMGCQALICAHNNIFNKEVLGADGYYFTTATDIKEILESIKKTEQKGKLANNLKKVEMRFSWELITENYLQCFKQARQQKAAKYAHSIGISNGY